MIESNGKSILSAPVETIGADQYAVLLPTFRRSLLGYADLPSGSNIEVLDGSSVPTSGLASPLFV